MAFANKEEALAFVQAMQLAVKGKPGFTWLVNELDDLYAYVDENTRETNEEER